MTNTTIEALLTSCHVQQTRVVAGDRGLNRTPGQVMVLRTPTPTTLPFHAIVALDSEVLGENPQFLYGVIQTGVRCHVSAIVVRCAPETHLFTAQIRNVADEAKLPLLQVPESERIEDWVIGAANALRELERGEAEQEQQTYRRMLDSVTGGYGPGNVADAVAIAVGNPIMVIDESGLVIELGWPHPVESRGALPEVGGMPAEQAERLLLRRLRELYSTVEPDNASDINDRTALTTPVEAPSTFKRTMVIGGQPVGAVRVFELFRTVSGTDISLLENATTMFALDALRRTAAKETERRSRTQFILDLMQGQLATEEAIEGRMELLGWAPNTPVSVLVVDIEDFESWQERLVSEERVQAKKVRMYDAVAGYLERCGQAPAVALASDELIVLLFGKASRTSSVVHAEKVKKVCDEALGGLVVAVGVGDPRDRLVNARYSHIEAWQALKLGRRLWGPGRITHISDLGAYRLLAHLDERQLQTLIVTTLSAAGAALDDEDLRRTVLEYLRADGSINAAASALWVHPNTVKYRLKKVWGDNRPSFQEKVNLFLALLADTLERDSVTNPTWEEPDDGLQEA